MRRFYENVELFQEDKDHSITLDGKNIRTPSRQILRLPTPALARAIAEEWRSQSDEIQPADMPLTQLANTAIDQTRPHRIRVIEEVAAYARTDLLCYRVAAPPDLAERQQQSWQPLLDWGAKKLGAKLKVTTDLAPVEQSEESLLSVYTSVARLDDFSLTGLGAATAASGSVIVALALHEGKLAVDEACSVSQLDEEYQCELWGEEPDAVAQRASVRQALATATEFMILSKPD